MELGEKWPVNFACAGVFYTPQICDVGPTALLPVRRKACCGFFRPKNPTVSAGFEPAILGTRGQRANHYTTEAVVKGDWAFLARSVGLLAAEEAIGLPFVGATEDHTTTH
jgi:hypothetical protein